MYGSTIDFIAKSLELSSEKIKEIVKDVVVI